MVPGFLVLTNPSDVFHSRMEFQICFISQKALQCPFYGDQNCPLCAALVACDTLWVGLVCGLLASGLVISPGTVLAAQLDGKDIRLFHLSSSVTCD
jgi:hypothetical protein